MVLIILALFPAIPIFAETVHFDNSWGKAGITVVEQSSQSLELNFSLLDVTLNTQIINGVPMTTIAMPSAMLGNDAHAPNLPGVGRFFAVPQGSNFTVELVEARTRLMKNMDIAPALVIPLDTDDSMPVYKKDPILYSTDAYYPESPVKVSEPRYIRGLDAGVVGITPFQYNPVTRDLLIYSDMKIKIRFHGGNGQFGENRLRSRFFDPILKMHMINAEMLPVIDYDARDVNSRANEAEYVIIVPDDPTFKSWGMVIKDFRTRQGIKTEVYTLTQTGSSTTAIKNWISTAVQTWSMPPVAMLLLGDAPGEGSPSIPVPTWSYTPSDNIYADVYSNDDLPDIVISRICAKTSANLEEMIMKFIDYETMPPENNLFYNRPTIAAGWQSDRWFVICADIVHGYFNHALGRSPNREYSGYSGAPTYWSTNQNTYMLVNYFGPSGLGYIPTVPSHLTDWGGNATRINNDFNTGSFFALHRDHGAPDGWSDPSYTTSNLPSLHNDPMLPVVLSINCSSGDFNNSSPSFAEAMYRMHHGASSIIAASDTSYSFVNDTYVFGMMDSFFPDFDPGYGGSTGDNILMPGFANMSGKYYLEASNWPYNQGDKDITYHLFHDHGDAFFSMCSEVPQFLSVSHGSTLALGATSFPITAEAGALVGLTVKEDERTLKIIGTGTGTGSAMNIPIDPQTVPRVMTVTVTKPNHNRYTAKVYIPENGTFSQYGTGLAGTGGYVPALAGTGDPIFGGDFEVKLTQGLGGTNGLMYLGLTGSNLNWMCGHLYVYPIDFIIPVTLGGIGAGNGTLTLPVNAGIAGVTLYVQIILADAAAPCGITMTNGLEVAFP
ncbi:MAG: C25 family cysteine peptidase [Planctomycetota bacterium]